MQQDYKYSTFSAAATGEFKDRGSRFIAYAYPVNNAIEIKDILKALKKEHPKAVHHCYAYRLGTDGNNFRANDDGEPSGSAAKPILGQIDSLGITNVLVVVVRYFGGTLLGVPGLINAFKTATANALSQIPLIQKWMESLYLLQFDYPLMGEVLYILKQNEATIYKQNLQLFCEIKAGIPLQYLHACLGKLSEMHTLKIDAIID